MHDLKPALEPCKHKLKRTWKSHNSDTIKVMPAAYARLQLADWVIIFSFIDLRFFYTNFPPTHTISCCKAAQDCYASFAFSPIPSQSTNMASRIPLETIALYMHRKYRETHLSTALDGHAVLTKNIETKIYEESDPTAMLSTKSLQLIALYEI